MALPALALLAGLLTPPAAHDRHGDPLPPHAIARLGTTRYSGFSAHMAVRFTPDGASILTGCSPVCVIDAKTGKRRLQFDVLQKGYVHSIVVTPDGTRAATVGSNSTLTMWDIRTGTKLWAAVTPKSHFTHGVAVTPDGGQVVVGVYDQTVCWYDAKTGNLNRVWESKHIFPRSLAFTPDGKWLVGGGESSPQTAPGLGVWDTAPGEFRPLKSNQRDDLKQQVWCVAVSPDGKTAAACGDDGAVRLWDIAEGTERLSLKGHSRPLRSFAVAFAPDGKTLATAGEDDRVRKWDAATGVELERLAGTTALCRTLSFSPDGKTLAAGGSVVRLWDWASGAEVMPNRGHRDEVACAVAGPNGTVLTAGFDGTVREWTPRTGEERRAIATPDTRVGWVAVSPDGRLAATAALAGPVRLWDYATGKELRQLAGLKEPARGLAFLGDGTNRLLAGDDSEVVVWDTSTGAVAKRHAFQNGRNNRWAVSPPGTHVAAGTNFGRVGVWELDTGRQVRQFSGHHQSSALAFSPDGRLIAAGDWSGRVMVWDVQTGATRWDGVAHTSHPTAVEFSPDGRTLTSASYDCTVALWEVSSGALRQRFGRHEDLASSVAFLDRGRLVASAGRDCTGLVWDVTCGAKPAKDLDAAWAALGGTDAVRAHAAVWQLAATPEAVPFLRKHLETNPLADAKRFERWDDAAFAELEYLGGAAAPLLREVLAGDPHPDAKRRLEAILKKADAELISRHRVRQLRALEALEYAGARDAIEALVKDAGDAFLTREAAAARERLKQQ